MGKHALTKNGLARLTCVCVALVFWLVSFVDAPLASGQTSFHRSEAEQLEGFLRGLQLETILVEHLEFEASRETDQGRRRELAARLAQIYSEKMISGREAGKPDWLSKTELLLKTYPDLATPSVRIAMLQSKYRDGENSFRDWFGSGRPPVEMNRLITDWRDLRLELATLEQKLEADYENQIAVLQTFPENQDLESRRLLQIEGLLLHANYLAGWSAYFHGVLVPDQRKRDMLAANSSFRDFLQIEPGIILNEVSPKWIDLSSDWNTRALVGLAMCQRGLNHVDQSAYCFDIIGNHSPVQQTRELRYVWDLNGRLYLNDFAAAMKLVESVEELSEQSAAMTESGRVAFWVATLKASIAIREYSAPVSATLMRAGLQGLARDFQGPILENFVTENRIQLTADDYPGLWISGYLDFHQAESANESALYEAAKIKLNRALDLRTDSTTDLDIARCRFLIARIDLEQGEYQTAANAFLQVAAAMDQLDSELAAESQWLAAASLAELSRTDSRAIVKANRAMDQILRRFPGSTYARRAKFEKLKLNVASLPPSEAIRRLEVVDTDDSNYRLALVEVTKIRYQDWLVAHQADQTDQAQKLAALISSERKLRQRFPVATDSIAKANLLVIDALFRSQPTNLEAIRDRLADVRSLTLTPGPVFQEFRFYEFQYAIRMGQQDRAKADAMWLAENAQGTRFESSALIQLAGIADEEFKSKSKPNPDELTGLIEIFERLVDLLGSSESQLKRLANARVAYVRLAELRLMAGEEDKALAMLETTNRVFPNHKSYLRKMALAYTETKRFESAVQIWRKLATGLEPGSELWIEAKFQLASNLYRAGDRQAARQVYDQTILLSNEIPKNWQPEFDKLNELLKIE